MTHISVLGTGVVGQTIATRLADLAHHVTMGSRDAANPKAVEWASGSGERGSAAFGDAIADAELVVNATAGAGSLPALESAPDGALDGKIILDVSNPLDFSAGFPPSLSVCNTDTLAEQIARRFPPARAVQLR